MTNNRIARLQAQLDAADKRMQALLHGISHDLRAPLRAIDGFTARLWRQLEATGDPAAIEMIARISATNTRMTSLVDGLLELARAGRAELRPTRVDVSMLADWCAAELQEAEPGREASIEVQQGLEVVGDERLLKTLLAQVLRNAWRFSAMRPRVEVEVTGRRTEDGLALVVRDHGIGFDMTYATRMLEPFQRLHCSDEGAGDGIGLAIADAIAVRHGGNIRAESAPGEGATFHVWLEDLALADAAE
ncbi:MAG TPA: ATP-binding protein [Thermomonas sp.]|nr:ATP-binding protein [Thermomonas sp.]